MKAVASREDSRNASCGSAKTFYAFPSCKELSTREHELAVRERTLHRIKCRERDDNVQEGNDLCVVVGDMGGVYAYGAETYDAIIITALAAAVAGTDDPSAVAAEINGVTGGGEKCTTFADCIALIDAGSAHSPPNFLACVVSRSLD